MLTCPRFLAEVAQHLPTALGFCDASGTGAGGFWIDPNGTGANFLWKIQWSADIVSDLLTWDNLAGGITNSDLELAALVLKDYCFPLVCSRPDWHTPLTGSDNTPTVSWCFREASTTNPIVSDLLRICAETNSGALLTPSLFYQPGPLNIMVDDTSRSFDLPDNNSLSFFRSKY